MKKEVRLSRKIKLLLRRLGFPRWLRHFGQKKYELNQHIFAFVIMTVYRLSLRRAFALLKMLGFKAPTFSALCKSRRRIPAYYMAESDVFNSRHPHYCVAIDSTGISRANPSHHYLKRMIGRRRLKAMSNNHPCLIFSDVLLLP